VTCLRVLSAALGWGICVFLQKYLYLHTAFYRNTCICIRPSTEILVSAYGLFRAQLTQLAPGSLAAGARGFSGLNKPSSTGRQQIWGLGFGAYGLEFRVRGFGFRVQGVYLAWGLEMRI
jgi:hypothetical protein